MGWLQRRAERYTSRRAVDVWAPVLRDHPESVPVDWLHAHALVDQQPGRIPIQLLLSTKSLWIVDGHEPIPLPLVLARDAHYAKDDGVLQITIRRHGEDTGSGEVAVLDEIDGYRFALNIPGQGDTVELMRKQFVQNVFDVVQALRDQNLSTADDPITS